MARLRIRFSWITCLAVVGVSVSAAQSRPPSPVTEKVAVDIVNIEVFASDKTGHPVADLTPKDLELLEDGKPVEITALLAL